MKDRFKFRAWDNKEHYYIPDEETNFCHGMMEYWLDREDCPLTFEQCTGLKDKNGKLIYEGDIVRVDSRVYYVEALTLVVRFHNGAFMAGDRFIDNNSNFMKVIGNIHENPELLGENKKRNKVKLD